ncbi:MULTISPECIES: hypothetical protein [unclassified Bartonella]|uniref:hypothetical protein n=1 Tax=unclassified Bartonella TaxID=2645622 RepID=UPI0035CF6786
MKEKERGEKEESCYAGEGYRLADIGPNSRELFWESNTFYLFAAILWKTKRCFCEKMNIRREARDNKNAIMGIGIYGGAINQSIS